MSADGPREATRSRLHAPLLVGLATAVCLVPYLNKPFHIDDTVFLRVAEQIQAEPLSPYDFEYNWFGNPHSMWIVMQHPPLHSYVLAFCGLLGGMHEVWLHACYLLVAVGCSLLMYSLAHRFCRHPMLATALTLAAPAFLVSATSLMADVLLQFFWLLAIWAQIRCADRSRPSGLWLAGLAAAAAAMTKYFGFALVPLLCVDCMLRSRRFEASIRDNSFFVHVLVLGLPVAALGVWGAYALTQCGVFHPLGAASYAMHERPLLGLQLLTNVGQTLSFLGGGSLWCVFLIPLAFRLPRSLLVITAMLTAVIAASGLLLDEYETSQSLGGGEISRITRLGDATWYSIAVLGATTVLAVSWASLRTRRDADSVLLVLWFVGSLVFSALFNWTVNARAILPAVFPAAVLCVRWVETWEAPQNAIRWLRWSVIPTIAVALLVAWGDFDYARASKSFAQTAVRRLISRGETVYFSGHWGFQYYMEEEAALPLDYQRPVSTAGIFIAFPAVNSSVDEVPVPTEYVEEAMYKSSCGLHTMSLTGRAGFYSNLSGPVPFNYFPDRVVDRFVIRRVIARDRTDRGRP